MAEPLRVVVAGHVNAGKTTLVRTLARQAGFGNVAVLPGTTLRNGHALAGEGETAIDWVDTPGFEDPVALTGRFAALPQPGPVERLRALLRQPEVVQGHPNEWRALSAALDADAVLLVVDSVELVLPKHRATLELLQAGGRPMLLLLNRPGHAQSQAEAWEAAAAAHGLREVVRFDAGRPAAQAMPALLRTLGAAVVARRPEAAALEPAWQAARQRRHQGSLALIAESLVALAARRETLPAAVAGDPAQKEQATAAFREAVLAEAGAARQALIVLHGFEGQDPGGGLRAVAGRWEDDLFNAEVLKDAGGKLAGGAALGAAIGLGADVALAGLSLGAGTAVGATVGGIASQGFSAFSRKVLNRLTGQLDLSVEDGVLVALADGLLASLQALQARAHGAEGPWDWPAGLAFDEPAQADLLDALRPARGHPEWAAAPVGDEPGPAPRRRSVEAVAALLATRPARAWAAAPGNSAPAGQVTAVRDS